MIRSKKELKFYLAADSIMNRGYAQRSIGQRIKELIKPDYIMDFLRASRRFSYHIDTQQITPPTRKNIKFYCQYGEFGID